MPLDRSEARCLACQPPGVNPDKKAKGTDPTLNPGLDMGLLFKCARNELFPCPDSGFGVSGQRHAFAVLTDFGNAPLSQALEKTFEDVRH